MFGSADIKTRPLRLAYLVDPNNVAQVREAIRLSCTLWGGPFFPIIPLYKRMPSSWRDGPLKAPTAKKVILGYLDAFDPDVLVQFSSSVPPYVAELGIRTIRPQEIWPNPERNALSPRFGIGVFEILGKIYDEWFKYKPKYPLKVRIPTFAQELRLFWTSVFGDYSSHIASFIKKDYAEPLEISEFEASAEAFDALTGRDTLFPRRIASWSLNRYGGLRFGRDACVYFMDATKLEDIVDYWNLRATGRDVLPLPKQCTSEKSFIDAITAFLTEHRRPWAHNPTVCDVASFIRSRNSSMDEMKAFAQTLTFNRKPDDPSKDAFYTLQHWYPRVWDEWARSKDGGVADVYGDEDETIDFADLPDATIRLKSILPKLGHRDSFHSEARCANEIALRFYGEDEHLAEAYPKSRGSHFVRAISGLGANRNEWRIGRHGLVKLVRRAGSESRRIPSSESIFFAWLADLGWKAELSSPGILAKQIHKKLNGYPSIIADKSLLGLIEHMNGGSVRKDGTPSKENKVGGDREVSVSEVKNRLKEKSGRRSLHDDLLEKGVFKLGLKAQCPHCFRSSWFALGTLRESLDCPRCLNSFPGAGNVDKGSWFYKTAGPFSVPNYADGAYAVLLTLDMLSERKLTTLHTTPVVSFKATAPGKKELEADVAMFWQELVYGEHNEGLLFGECKTYGRFETKDFDRMRYIASTFPGAVLVFSTLRDALTEQEVKQIARIAKAGRKYWKAERPVNPVLVLTGKELFHWSGPPYCWDDATRKRFENAHGLLEFCDATQQLYLGLPSWHEDWRKKWDARGKQRAARAANASRTAR